MKKPARIALLGAFGVAAVAAAFFAGRARAAGIPDADVLTYTGYLEDGDGAPLTGDHSIEVQFLDAADATSELCGGSLDSVTLQSGRFQVPLPGECVDAVKANQNLWVEVKVDGASLGPTRLGAVPFAVEAGHATTADSAASAAAAEGALATRLDDLEAGIPVVTGWTDFTPVVVATNGDTVTGIGQNGGRWRRVGDSIEVQATTRWTNEGVGSAFLTWKLPESYTPVPVTLSLVVGSAELWNGSIATACAVSLGTDGRIYPDCQGLNGLTRNLLGGAGEHTYVSLTFTVPVTGWTVTE